MNLENNEEIIQVSFDQLIELSSLLKSIMDCNGVSDNMKNQIAGLIVIFLKPIFIIKTKVKNNE